MDGRRDRQPIAASRFEVTDAAIDDETAARIVLDLEDLAGGLAVPEQQRRRLPRQKQQAPGTEAHVEPAQGRLKSQGVRVGNIHVGTFGDPGSGEARNKKAAWRPTIVKIRPVELCSARALDGVENHD